MDMKKIMGTILLVGICLNTPVYANDIAIRTPVIAMQTSTKNANAEAKLKSQAPKYKNNTTSIYLEFTNNSNNTIQLAGQFRFERMENGKWSKVPVMDGTGVDGYLDYASYELPIKSGEVTGISADIRGYIPRGERKLVVDSAKNMLDDDENLTQLPVGKYRIIVQDTDKKEYTAEFELVAEDVFIDPSTYEIKMERPIYDGNVEKIKFTFYNHTNEDLVYGTYFSIEKFENGKWEECPVRESSQKYFPSIGTVLFANSANFGIEFTDRYKKPFSPGKYRYVKDLGLEKVGAEFEITDINQAMTLPDADKVELTYKNGNKSGTITYTEKEKDYRSSVVHELLAFQENKKARSVSNGVETIQVVVKDKQGKSVTVELFAESESTSAMVGNTLYAIPDPNVIPRIRADMEKLGAFVPSTGETIIQALKEKDVFKDVKFKKHNFTTPFKRSGWLANRDVSNVNLSIFEYDSPVQVDYQSSYIYNNGYAIRVENFEEGGSGSELKEYNWEQPPHYFKAGKCLVMYCGTDEKALTALKNIFGDEVDAALELD